MKCRGCRAPNLRDAVTCWACGVRLQSPSVTRRPRSFRPDAMRHYSAAPAAVVAHRAWVDGLVLLCTISFGLLMGYFIIEVLPTGGSPQTLLASVLSLPNPLDRFAPAPTMLAPQAVGTAQEARSVVIQVADLRRSAAEGGREAGPGQEFIVVTVVVDNQGRQPVAFDLADWTVMDSAGGVRQAERFRSAGWLGSGRLDPGQSARGQLAFAVPEGDAVELVRFTATSLRTVFRWDVAAPPASV
ncbi:MAG: DUF4352 domain-containing protein [Chloroflexota bacterium]|nr:DUF4352 domain-containing protein [Chloroflexota bacterium]